ncbi:MAG: hypothetical protein NVSMB2_04290 [Chloroflexota bacterium]
MACRCPAIAAYVSTPLAADDEHQARGRTRQLSGSGNHGVVRGGWIGTRVRWVTGPGDTEWQVRVVGGRGRV